MSADLTVSDLVSHFGKTRETILDWLKVGRFPGAYKAGRTWRIPSASLEAMKRENAVRPLRKTD